jgi:hypothetical protein
VSIWASWQAPDVDTHEDSCARWDKSSDGCWEISDRPCDCGQPDAPLVYHGSHVMPEHDGERGGWVDIASLSRFVRLNRDDPDGAHDEEGWEPFLRFGVNQETVILTDRNVRMIHASLTEWLAGLAAIT